MRLGVFALIAALILGGCSQKPRTYSLWAKPATSYELKMKHIEDCKAVVDGKAPKHFSPNLYSPISPASQSLPAQAAGGFLVGAAEGWMRAKANSERNKKRRECMKHLGYARYSVSQQEFQNFKKLNNTEKTELMGRVIEESASGKRKKY